MLARKPWRVAWRRWGCRALSVGKVGEMEEPSDHLAFFGLGAMGFPMAANLAQRGSNVLVWNRSRSVAEKHEATYGTSAIGDDFSEISERSHSRPAPRGLGKVRAVFVCLPTSVEVEDVMKRAAPHMEPGSVVVDCTSGHPLQTRAIADWLMADHGIHMMDCAVSGGPGGARQGTLAAFVGSNNAEIVKQLVPDIETFAKHIVHLGPVSSGHAVKAINNALNVSNLLCVSEGLLALKNLGISPERALAVINKSSGRSLMSEQRVPQDVLSGWFNYGFKLGLMKKDVDIANDLLDEHFDQATVIRNTRRLMEKSLTTLGEDVHPDSDYTEVIKVLEAQAGTSLRTEGTWEWTK